MLTWMDWIHVWEDVAAGGRTVDLYLSRLDVEQTVKLVKVISGVFTR